MYYNVITQYVGQSQQHLKGGDDRFFFLFFLNSLQSFWLSHLLCIMLVFFVLYHMGKVWENNSFSKQPSVILWVSCWLFVCHARVVYFCKGTWVKCEELMCSRCVNEFVAV